MKQNPKAAALNVRQSHSAVAEPLERRRLLSDFSFGPAISWAAGSKPKGIVTADFNGDGKADVAVADTGSNTVSVLLGNGSGGFAAPKAYAVATSPQTITVGDLDGDGHPDLAVTAQDDPAKTNDSIYVLYGQGNGRFFAAHPYTVGDRPTFIAIGDANADGKPDLVVANENSANVTVLAGNGSGEFAGAKNVAVGPHPSAVAIGDFNADGRPDLAVTEFLTGKLDVLLAGGGGNFSSPRKFTVPNYSVAMTATDFDGDGKTDLVVTNGATPVTERFVFPQVTFQKGDGAGGFAFASGVFDVFADSGNAFADFNGGTPDLVFTEPAQSRINIVQGNAAPGSFGGGSTFSAHKWPDGVAVADFNGDRRTDIVVSNSMSSVVSVLLNTDPKPVGTPVIGSVTASPNPVTVGKSVTLTAVGVTEVGGSVKSVGFYRESNHAAGLQTGTGGDTLLSTDTSATGGWTGTLKTTALAAGTYTLYARATDTAGATSAAVSASLRVNAAPGATITGRVYRDDNQNGKSDPGTEANLVGVTVWIDLDGDKVIDAGEPKTVSQADGNYTFSDVSTAGTSPNTRVRVAPPAGDQQTQPQDGNGYAVSFTPGVLNANKDFGLFAGFRGSITGELFNDANGNGISDNHETVAVGREVWLDLNDNGVIDAGEPTQSSDSTGSFDFEGLATRTYHVRRVFPTGYVESTPPRVIHIEGAQTVDVFIGSKRV